MTGVFLQRLGLLSIISGPTQPTPLTSPPVSASYMYARDITNGWDLYTKSEDTQWGSNVAASIAKLCTAIVLLEHKAGSLSETITVTTADLVSGTNMSLQADDVISYGDLLGGLLTISGNDAAFAIAREIGTHIYDEAGSGTTGVVRFVEAMTIVASDLSLTNTVFTAPDGVNVSGNKGTAREWVTLAEAAWDYTDIRAASISKHASITITGTNARTYDVRHTSAFVSGPYNTPSLEIGYTGCEASKTGSSGSSEYSVIVLFELPDGTELIILVVKSTGNYERYMDMSAVLLRIKEDFPYLTENDTPPTDSDWSSVVLLAGADTGFDDESSYERVLTAANGASRVTSSIYGSHSFTTDGVNDHIHTPHNVDMRFSGDDFIVEFMYSHTSEPSSVGCFMAKYDSGANQREWAIMYQPSSNAIYAFISGSGTGWETVPNFIITPSVFFNGAQHHIAFRRVGNTFAISVNGERSAPYLNTSTTLYTGTAKFIIGARQNNTTGIAYPMPGKFDEIRITKGTPRHTLRKFTPPGQAFPRSA